MAAVGKHPASKDKEQGQKDSARDNDAEDNGAAAGGFAGHRFRVIRKTARFAEQQFVSMRSHGDLLALLLARKRCPSNPVPCPDLGVQVDSLSGVARTGPWSSRVRADG